MRSTGATLLVAGALGLATYHYGTTHERGDDAGQMAKVTRILTSPAAEEAASAERPRVFSPQRPLMVPADRSPTAEAPRRVAGAPAGAAAAPMLSPVSSLPAPAPLPAVEAIAPRRAPAAATEPPAKLIATKPRNDDERDELVRNLQKELKRVGCYEGDVDGDWGTGSKRAMRTFTERVNATLPTDDPDYILLTLVRGHAGGTVCGKGCPSTQAYDADGRCVPRAILAQAARRTTGDKSEKSEKIALTQSRETEKRDLGKKEAERARQVAELPKATLTPRQLRPAIVAESSITAGAPPAPQSGASQPMSWRTETLPPVAQQAAPLPGRMAIGGPIAPGAAPPPVEGLVTLRSGVMAALEQQDATSIAQPAPFADRDDKERRAERDQGGSASERAQRQREARPVHRAPAAPRANAPSRPSNSKRYSSFNRPSAVQNFFFNPQRAF